MNEQFYIAENGQKRGPFTFEEMKTKNVTKETLVWTEGLDSWTKAEHIALLKDILRKTPPPLPNDEPKSSTQQMPPIPESNTQATGKYFGYELASRASRFFAVIIEGLILAIPILIFTEGKGLGEDNYSSGSIIGGTIFSAILGAIFYPIWSGNLGHKIMGLKVIS